MLIENVSGRDTGADIESEGPGLGSSKVDIVIATPGRLTDHLRATPGFTLRHLRYLVLDEADRLLNQSYQGWLDLVMKAVSGIDVSTHSQHSSGLDHIIAAPPPKEYTPGSNTIGDGWIHPSGGHGMSTCCCGYAFVGYVSLVDVVASLLSSI